MFFLLSKSYVFMLLWAFVFQGLSGCAQNIQFKSTELDECAFDQASDYYECKEKKVTTLFYLDLRRHVLRLSERSSRKKRNVRKWKIKEMKKVKDAFYFSLQNSKNQQFYRCYFYPSSKKIEIHSTVEEKSLTLTYTYKSVEGDWKALYKYFL